MPDLSRPLASLSLAFGRKDLESRKLSTASFLIFWVFAFSIFPFSWMSSVALLFNRTSAFTFFNAFTKAGVISNPGARPSLGACVRMKDVEEAQQKIVGIIRKLEDSAEIVISRGGGDEIVV